MACYYVVISSTHLRDGQLRSIKGVFRGPIGARGARGARSEVEAVSSLYCELCNKQYERQQQYDNHTSSYDHHHRQRLKELKQREFYRLLGSRRQRRGREQQQERSSAHSVAGLGPMFRSTTVSLDTSVDDPCVVMGNTKDPETSQVGSSTQWFSSSPAEQDVSSVNLQPGLRNKPPEAPGCVTHFDRPVSAPSGTNPVSSASPRLWSETRVRPVCFSLPKRCSTLCHQSAAVFLQTSKKKMTQIREGVDHVDPPGEPVDPVNPQPHDALKPTEEKPKVRPCPDSTFLHRPKEPFHRVLSRDSATVLLWPSEMISYTRTGPSISFSVNPLLHNFRAGNTTSGVSVDKGAELEQSEPSVIKQAEQQPRQADVQGGGAPTRHERDRGDGGGRTASAEELVAHCNSGKWDENALNLPPNSKYETHLVLPGKKTKRKRIKRRRRGMRRKKKEAKKQKARPCSREEGPGGRSTEIGKDQAASADHRGAELSTHLPVNHFNRCNQLCAQVNGQASRHLSQQSVSEWGQGLRKRHGGDAACSTAISLVPGSDIEIPRCPAITPRSSQSCTDVWEAPAERQRGENGVVQENAAKERGLGGKRTFDEAFNREALCCQNQNVPIGKPTADRDIITEPVTIALTSSRARDVTPTTERPSRKKLKAADKCLEPSYQVMCFSSDLSVQGNCGSQEIQVTNTSSQRVTEIVKDNTDSGSHFVSRHSLCVEEACIATCSSCHSDTRRATSECGSYPPPERQNFTSEQNTFGQELTAKTARSEVGSHCMTSVSKALTDLGPAETLSCQFDCTNHFTNCNCSEKDTNDGVVNVVLISTHPEQTGKEDEKKKQAQETRKEDKREGDTKEENKRVEGKVQERRKMERTDRTKAEWACLPPPPPYPVHHTFLHQHFVPLCQPLPPYPLFTCHFSPHVSPFAPLLPVAPVPLLDGPYPLSAFPSLQSGGPPLYSPPPPALVPTQLIFSKSAAFSIS